VKNNFGKSLIKFVLVAVFVAGAAWVVMNRQTVIDWARLATYTPSAEVKALADNTQLEQHARNLFYASDPQVQDSGTFNQSCSSNEQTIVLGCYKGQRIYLFNIKDERFNGIKEVTAAHEMLHAAYERMDESERRKVDAMLQPLVENMKDPRLLELVELYNKTEPGELYNEMHSILATESAELTPELEEYYKQYFKDRGVVVRYANQYQAIFTESKNKIDEYDRQLTELKPQIDQNNSTLQRTQTELESQNNQLNQYRARSQISQYNQLVPSYNAKVAEFNALIETTRGLVSKYNKLVEERNNQVAAQTNLYDSINSNYQPATKN
jgi:DNA repair exonuclease SbcCD ATPase subunit